MPSRRLLGMAAGTGACNNLVRSLKAGAAGVYIVGCNDDRFTLKQSTADRLYLLRPSRRRSSNPPSSGYWSARRSTWSSPPATATCSPSPRHRA
jgi:hypothetical protein